MASPAAGGGGGRALLLQRLAASKTAYNAFVLLVFGLGILLMVLPAELISYSAPEKPGMLLLEAAAAAGCCCDAAAGCCCCCCCWLDFRLNN